MDTSDMYVDHLAWCGLIALYMARQEGIVTSPVQENIFLCKWLATAEKKRLFRRELAHDIRWLLKEGREKGLRADLSGKLEYLWRASSGDLLEQNDLFRLQHVMHALKLTGIKYGVLNENEWEESQASKHNLAMTTVFLRKRDLDTGFDEEGNQIKPFEARINADLSAVDALLSRAGWSRKMDNNSPTLHKLVSDTSSHH